MTMKVKPNPAREVEGTRFRTGASQASDRLGKIARAEDLECLLARLKPAQSNLHLIYEGA